MILYMEVTRDKYELPIFISPSAREVAENAGTDINTVYSLCSRHKRGVYKRTRFVKVEIGDIEGGDDDLPPAQDQ